MPSGQLCHACFDGNYPIPVADGEKGKHLLEPVGGPRAR